MNKLKSVVDSLDDILEPLRPFYAEAEGGKFILQAEGMVTKETLDGFRERNLNITREKEKADADLAKYRKLGEDPEALEREVTELRGIKGKVDTKDLIDKSGFNEAVERRTAEMKATLEGQNRALQQANEQLTRERDEATTKYRNSMVDRAITDAAIRARVVNSAIPDVLTRARDAGWTINDKGKVVQLVEGEVAFGSNGADPLTPEEWINGHLAQTASHFFPRPTGANALGSDGTAGGINFWSKEGWNRTEQARLYRENPAKAEQMARAAGLKVGATRPAP